MLVDKDNTIFLVKAKQPIGEGWGATTNRVAVHLEGLETAETNPPKAKYISMTKHKRRRQVVARRPHRVQRKKGNSQCISFGISMGPGAKVRPCFLSVEHVSILPLTPSKKPHKLRSCYARDRTLVDSFMKNEDVRRVIDHASGMFPNESTC